MENTGPEPSQCFNCNSNLSSGGNFCRLCGAAQNQEQLIVDSKKWPNLKEIAIFLSIEASCCIIVAVITPTWGIDLAFDMILAITAILFFTSDWKENGFLLKWPDFSLKKLLFFITLSIIASVAVSFLVSKLNQSFFHQELSNYSLFKTHQYGKYIMIISLAIFPAIFEELAYRGYLMQKLLNVVDQKEAAYITSFLFFLMHFSILSFFWLLPFALILAYIRMKEKTIWYGVFIHFFFNLTSCFIDIIRDNHTIPGFNN